MKKIKGSQCRKWEMNYRNNNAGKNYFRIEKSIYPIKKHPHWKASLMN